MICYRSVFAVAVLVFLWHNPMLKATSPSEADANLEEDDHNWWKGAEEVDLTFHFEESDSVSFEEAFDYSDFFFLSNESCLWNMDCDSLSMDDVPPDFISTVPPPPLPPFLRELEEYVQERWIENRKLGKKSSAKSEQSLHGNENCSICDWALGNNSDYIFLTRLSETKRLFGGDMLLVLISIGIVSAAIGAFVTAFLVRCRSMKIHRKGKGFSFMIVKRIKFKDYSGSKKNQSPSFSVQKEIPTLQRSWPLQLNLSQSSFQVPLDNSVGNSQATFENNARFDDAYSNSEGIYTEIDPAFCSVSEQTGSSLSFSNPYSETDDSLRQSNDDARSKLRLEGIGIENDGYVPSETDRIYPSKEVVPNSPFSVSHYSSFPNETKENIKSYSKSTFESPFCQSALRLDEFAQTINCNDIALQPLHFLSPSVIQKPNVHSFYKDVFSNPRNSNQSHLLNSFSQTRKCEASSKCNSVSTFQVPTASSETFELISDKSQTDLVKREDNESSKPIKKRPLPAFPQFLNSIRNENEPDP